MALLESGKVEDHEHARDVPCSWPADKGSSCSLAGENDSSWRFLRLGGGVRAHRRSLRKSNHPSEVGELTIEANRSGLVAVDYYLRASVETFDHPLSSGCARGSC